MAQLASLLRRRSMCTVRGAFSMLTVALVLALTSCGSEDQATRNTSSGSDEETTAQVMAAAQRVMEENDLKAVLVRVTKDGDEVATVALGESMTGVPATEEMHFRNGAIAISYLGTVLLQLVDEGQVELDDTIDAWLPELPASDRITLRMLANSTSGYVDYVPMDSFIDALYKDPFRAWTPDELIEMATDEPLLYEPGTNWSYSHVNFVILGEALAPRTITNSGIGVTRRSVLLELLGRLGVLVFIPERFSHLFRCSGNR